MFIRFVVNNFLSFNEEREFTMLAGSFKAHKHHVYNAGKVDVLKASAIYGANGAGKSNLIKAIEFLQDTVNEGGLKQSVNDKKFKLDKSNETKPISFEIEFFVEQTIFAFGASFDDDVVVEEWLYESGVTKEDKLIYERRGTKSGKPEIKMASKFRRTQKQKLLIELLEENLLKSNELLLGKTAELKIDILSSVKSKIVKDIIIIHPGSKFHSLVPPLTQSSQFKTFANELLKSFDTGVVELGVETIDFEKYFGDDDEELKKELIKHVDSGKSVTIDTAAGGVIVTKEDRKYIVKKVVAHHLNSDEIKVVFELSEESDGTQRLLDFIPAFHGMLDHGMTFIIDEIDQSLHPTLLKALVRKVMADETTKGQLIFTTHESNLLDLDIFRQDEIWFVEKDRKVGGSQMYSLSDFKPRYDLDIRKGYLKGRFGAIPFLANLEDLNWETADAEETRL